MSDHAEAAELCAREGLDRPAALLRALATEGLSAHVVCFVEEGFLRHYDADEGYDSICRSIHFSRDSAEAEALRLNVRAFREVDLFESRYVHRVSDGTYSYVDLSESEPDAIVARLREIFGPGYEFPSYVGHPMPIFPAAATDDQMRAVLDVIELRYYYVAESRFHRPDPTSIDPA